MAPPPLVAVSDLADWLGVTIDGSGHARAEAVINAVSALIRSEAGHTWETTPVPDTARAIALDVAGRVYLNPRNVAQESVGPFSYSYAPGALAGLDFTESERRRLRSLRGASTGLWSQAVTRDGDSGDTVWVPVRGTAAQFPWYADGDL